MRKAVRFVTTAAMLGVGTGYALGEPIAMPDELAYQVTASNATALGYVVTIDTPGADEPEFKRLHLTFPDALGDLRYAYSSVVYSKDGKRLLSYRPDAYTPVVSRGQKELYVLANQGLLACVSFVSVYMGRNEGGDHPPTRYVSVDLASFVSAKPAKCPGKVDARGFY